MKKLHQIFIFIFTMIPAFCFTSAIESTQASTFRFLQTHGANLQRKITLVDPNNPNYTAVIFMSLAAYQPGPARRTSYVKKQTPADHGVSPVEHAVTPTPSPEIPSK